MEEQFLYDIKNAARYLGVAPSTLRYWESQGLVQAGRDSSNDYRQYSLHDLIEASEIAFYRRLGVSIKELKGYQTLSPRGLDEALARTEQDIEQHLKDLKAMRSRLAKQRNLNAQAKRLASLGMHAGAPTIRSLRPIDYRSPESWQLLVEDPWRYAVMIDAADPDVVIEAISDGPSPAKAVANDNECPPQKDAFWTAPSSESTIYLECLLKVGSSLETSNAEALFSETQRRGLSPTVLVGTYLLTATEDGRRWDYHRAWVAAASEEGPRIPA